MKNNNLKWNSDEDRQLIELVEANFSYREIARELGRTEAAVQARASTVRNNQREGQPADQSKERIQRLEERIDTLERALFRIQNGGR